MMLGLSPQLSLAASARTKREKFVRCFGDAGRLLLNWPRWLLYLIRFSNPFLLTRAAFNI